MPGGQLSRGQGVCLIASGPSPANGSVNPARTGPGRHLPKPGHLAHPNTAFSGTLGPLRPRTGGRGVVQQKTAMFREYLLLWEPATFRAATGSHNMREKTSGLRVGDVVEGRWLPSGEVPAFNGNIGGSGRQYPVALKPPYIPCSGGPICTVQFR